MLPALERPGAKRWGWLALWTVACLAVGNAWATKDALDGSAKWWNRQCHDRVQAHIRYDRWRERHGLEP